MIYCKSCGKALPQEMEYISMCSGCVDKTENLAGEFGSYSDSVSSTCNNMCKHKYKQEDYDNA